MYIFALSINLKTQNMKTLKLNQDQENILFCALIDYANEMDYKIRSNETDNGRKELLVIRKEILDSVLSKLKLVNTGR